MATSLKARVGPWKSSSRKAFGPVCTSGATAGWRKVPYASSIMRPRSPAPMESATKGFITSKAACW